MSRNWWRCWPQKCLYWLEKPVLFDVTELSSNLSVKRVSNSLEKPVLFDVTEHFILFGFDKILFQLEKPVLFDVTEQVKETFLCFNLRVGKAGFIWCHGTLRSYLRSLSYLLEKPVLFDVTEHRSPPKMESHSKALEKPVLFDVTEQQERLQNAYGVSCVGKAGFIWCHGTLANTLVSSVCPCWKSRFYLMSRNLFT